MEPLIALVCVTVGCLIMGRFGFERVARWPIAVRAGVSAMFVLTGLAHFVGKREELIQMVPPALPAAALLVTLTGLLELAGAVGLWLPQTRVWAASGLSALLLAVFPANVYYALSGSGVYWGDQLLPRSIAQLVFLAATMTLLIQEHTRVRGKWLRDGLGL